MSKLFSALSLVALCLVPTAAVAETSASDLFALVERLEDSKKRAYEQVIQDEYYGMIWVKTYLFLKGDNEGLWCPPPEDVLSGAELLQLMKAFVAENPQYGDSPFGAVILFAVLDKFPCAE